jgi:hypothetical protein
MRPSGPVKAWPAGREQADGNRRRTGGFASAGLGLSADLRSSVRLDLHPAMGDGRTSTARLSISSGGDGDHRRRGATARLFVALTFLLMAGVLADVRSPIRDDEPVAGWGPGRVAGARSLRPGRWSLSSERTADRFCAGTRRSASPIFRQRRLRLAARRLVFDAVAALADFVYLLIEPEGRFPASARAKMPLIGEAGAFALHRIH